MPKLTPTWIDVATMATGLDLKIASYTVEGANDGPTVGLTAGIHGDELVPVEVVRRVLAEMTGS